jgi:thioredoxin reductase (NADPH)
MLISCSSMSVDKHYKIVVIGSGPAGYTAAIYAARAGMEPLLISGSQPGGQLSITTDVENYPGFASTIQGPWLMEQMKQQAIHVGTEIIDDYVSKIDLQKKPFTLSTEYGAKYSADSVIIATGAQAKWMGIPSETKFQGFGVSGCATCDGFFFRNKKVIVIGGGNTAVEEALHLTHHASEVILVHRRDQLRAEKILQERLFKHPKIKILWNHVLEEVLGSDNPKTVTGVRLKDMVKNETKEMAIDGVFIAIGHSPNTAIFVDQIELDSEGYIITKPNSTKTNIPGVFACGDVQDKIYRQAVTAAGTGCMAALEAGKFLDE